MWNSRPKAVQAMMGVAQEELLLPSEQVEVN